MIWNEKEVSSLSDDELINANSKLSEMHSNYIEKTSNHKFLKRVGNNIPTMNPSFEKLREEVLGELKKRAIMS